MSLSPLAQDILKQIQKKNGTFYTSKPKNASGEAQYVWRMVQFMLVGHGPLACMPMTADFAIDQPPRDFLPEMPEELIAEKIAKCTPYDIEWVTQQAGSPREYFLKDWKKYGRRKHYIKTVLDPVVDEILNQINPNRMEGLKRWGRIYGVI